MDVKELYENNKDFKDYIDRFCKLHGIAVEEALQHKIIKEEVANYYDGLEK